MHEYEKNMNLLTSALGNEWHSLEFDAGPGTEPLRLEPLKKKINIGLRARPQHGLDHIESTQLIMTLVLKDHGSGSEPEHIVIAAVPGGTKIGEDEMAGALPREHTLQPFGLQKLENAGELMGSQPGLFSPFPLDANSEHRKKITLLIDHAISESEQYYFLPLNRSTQALVKGVDIRKVLEHMQKDGRGKFSYLIHDKPISW